MTFKKTLTFTSLPNIEMCTVQEQIGAQKLPCQRKPSVFLPEAGVFRVPRHSRGAVPGGGGRGCPLAASARHCGSASPAAGETRPSSGAAGAEPGPVRDNRARVCSLGLSF